MEKDKSYYYKILIFTAIIACGLDLLSKYLVIKFVANNGYIEVIPNFFSIVYSVNMGAAFGIMQGMLPLFFMIILVFVIIIFRAKEKLIGSKQLALAYGLILGGAFGNGIDRLLIPPFGGVTDFLDFHLTISSRFLSYPTFNVADICIVVGCVLFLFFYKKTSCPVD